MYVRKSLIILLCLFAFAACNRNNAATPSGENPPSDLKENVEKTLAQAGFEHDVNVDVDHQKGVITLKGRVRSEELKARAGQAAQSVAAGHIVSNELSVEPVDQEKQARAIESNVDDAIEKNYKAGLIANRLDNQHINFHSKNSVLTLEGSVATSEMRAAAERLGSTIPNVQQVINKLDVKP